MQSTTLAPVTDSPPCVIVYENVPGLLNSKDNAFGCFLAGLAGEEVPLQPAGAKWSNAGVVLGPQRAVAWRVLDAQYLGLAQRRNRVFVVASAREGFDPAELLLEFEGVRRDSPPSRTTGEGVAGTLEARTTGGGFPGTDGACSGHVVPSVRIDRSVGLTEGTHPIARGARMRAFGDYVFDETASTTKARDYKDATDLVVYGEPTYGLTTEQTRSARSCSYNQSAHETVAVRRLMPIEAERLQGFPDGHTNVPVGPKGKPAADGPRYKSLGNSMATNVMSWIGRRIVREIRTAEYRNLIG